MSPSSEPYVCEAKYAGWLTNPVRRLITDPRRMLKGLAHPGDAVADIGCGPGFFTLPLAESVGGEGSVIAVDLQAAMLEKVRERAEKRGLMSRIRLHQCGPDSLGLADAGPLDFALAFWMIHEVPGRAGLLAEVHGALRPGGRLLAVEPKRPRRSGRLGRDARGRRRRGVRRRRAAQSGVQPRGAARARRLT